MKYHMIAYVTVSAASEREACHIIERQCASIIGRRSDVAYVDAEAENREPECGDCGALLPAGTLDYDLCPTCAHHDAVCAADLARCEGRYDAPMPREEPFQVTYRCLLPTGHAGPCGHSETPETAAAVDPHVTSPGTPTPRENIS